MRLAMYSVFLFVVFVVIVFSGCPAPLTPSDEFELEGFIPIQDFEGPEREMLEETGRWQQIVEAVDYIKASPSFIVRIEKGEVKKSLGAAHVFSNGKRGIEIYRPYLNSNLPEMPILLGTAATILHEALHLALETGEEEYLIAGEEKKFADEVLFLHPEIISSFDPLIELSLESYGYKVVFKTFSGIDGISFESEPGDARFFYIESVDFVSTPVPTEYIPNMPVKARLFARLGDGEKIIFSKPKEFNF